MHIGTQVHRPGAIQPDVEKVVVIDQPLLGYRYGGSVTDDLSLCGYSCKSI